MVRLLPPTTKAQISGHKFLKKRLIAGLILGDIRMIHDPLGRRNRALGAGVFSLILGCIALCAFSFFKPATDPGNAQLISTRAGGLYVVSQEGALHPIPNITSGRLLLGEPAQPKKASDEVVRDYPRGQALGIVDAPPWVDPQLSAQHWAVCSQGNSIIVSNFDAVEEEKLGEHQAILMAYGQDLYVVDHSGRRLLPPRDTVEARVIYDALGIDYSTPRWHINDAIFGAITEQPAYSIPSGIGGHNNSFALVDNQLHPINAFHAQILRGVGSQEKDIHIADYGMVDTESIILPEFAPEFIDPTDRRVCASQGAMSVHDSQSVHVVLVGNTEATHYDPHIHAAQAVETGSGLYIIGETGLKHFIPSPDVLHMIGGSEPVKVPWAIIRLLPDGSELSPEVARSPIYQRN